MFGSAIEAAAAAASAWTPERADPAGGRECCHLCLHRYRLLVLDGPLRGLPHAVAHAAVVAVDDVIAERIEAALERIAWDAWLVPGLQEEREREFAQRSGEARGALHLLALEELGAEEARLTDLRRRLTDPAMEAYLLRHRMTEVPRQWEA